MGRGDVGHVLVADEMAVAVVAADGERPDVLAPAHQVLQLAGKGDLVAGLGVAIEQGPDADGVPGGDQPVLAGIVEDEGELGVHVAEHIQPVLVVQGQQDLAVAARLELVPRPLEDGLFKPEAVQLPVADHAVRPAGKGLHPLRRQPHDGKPAEAHQPEGPLDHPLVVGAAADGPQQVFLEFGGGQVVPGVTHDTAHNVLLLCSKKYGSKHPLIRTNAAVSVVPPGLPAV